MRHLIKYSLQLIFLFATTISCNNDERTPSEENTPTPLKIGDMYEGGMDFFIDETGEHGLIAATEDLDRFPDIWGCVASMSSTAQQVAIATATTNTRLIVSNCPDENTASKWCAELELNGFNNWYLPSINELEVMYIHKNAIVNFEQSDPENSIYMSSSESLPDGDEGYYKCYVSDFSATLLLAATRKVNTSKGNNSLKARPVRSF